MCKNWLFLVAGGRWLPGHLEDAVREMLPDPKTGHRHCREDGTFDGLYVDCTFGRGEGRWYFVPAKVQFFVQFGIPRCLICFIYRVCCLCLRNHNPCPLYRFLLAVPMPISSLLGGHTEHILSRLSGSGRLIAFDVDSGSGATTVLGFTGEMWNKGFHTMRASQTHGKPHSEQAFLWVGQSAMLAFKSSVDQDGETKSIANLMARKDPEAVAVARQLEARDRHFGDRWALFMLEDRNKKI